MNKNTICVDKVSFSYHSDDGDGTVYERKAIDNLSLNINKGEYVALLGPNGSGKSTLAKLIDIIETPNEGNVVVFGSDTKDDECFWKIRENTAVVFQNPDNQIVGTTVEEDVAFGPENLGIPNPMLRERVDKALKDVGLYDLRFRQTGNLSGGQKQKLAIAGALAMEPSVLILDEATAMLDPVCRDEFLSIVEDMRRKKDLTLITITHDMSEAARCEKVFVIEKGKVILEGKPNEIFAKRDAVEKAGLDVPEYIKLTFDIADRAGVKLTSEDLVNEDTAALKVEEILRDCKTFKNADSREKVSMPQGEKIISIEGLCSSYDGKTKALEDINLDVYKGEILAIVGRSGCGKTTLISHFNAIMKPQEGSVKVIDDDGNVLDTDKKKSVEKIRQLVGLAFQYPEYQLFEETVYKDICYGLRKSGLEPKDQKKMVEEACDKVGFDKNLLNESPFSLSGGQKRRAALAGVIVMNPKVLVLDEPASGLDPRGRKDMFKMIKALKESGTTIILVSHNMDEAALHADRICIIEEGKVVLSGTPEKVFEDRDKAKALGIGLPKLTEFAYKIRDIEARKNPDLHWRAYDSFDSKELADIIVAGNREVTKC